jgi:hypothetical protein
MFNIIGGSHDIENFRSPRQYARSGVTNASHCTGKQLLETQELSKNFTTTASGSH